MSSTAPSTTTTTTTDLTADLTAYLTQRHLPPTPTWLASFLSSHNRSGRLAATPLPALRQTALFRILASDLRASVAGCGFPAGVGASLQENSSAAAGLAAGEPRRETRLARCVVAQVLHALDVGTSLGAQLEALEGAAATAGAAPGRAVVRVDGSGEAGATAAAGTAAATAAGGKGPWKLLLQDSAGVTAWGVTLDGPAGTAGGGGGWAMGTKVLLQAGAVVARGVVLLRLREGPACSALVLGGRVEEWDRPWREGAVERVRGMVVQMRRVGDGVGD